ncbi:MAG: class I SAM-dependent methyltransferase [bacterium]
MKSSGDHWDKIFCSTEDAKLGWYEKDSLQTFKLLNQIPGWESATIFIPGAGTSNLIEELLDKGAKLILNDISCEAIDKVKSRLKNKDVGNTWICQDIAQPIDRGILNFDIWIDRAVLHFLTETDDIKGYFENVKSKLKVGGYAIFAEFSKTGAEECAGLKLYRYSVEELSQNLGASFALVSSFDHIYLNPYGDPRPYIYALYKREK